MPKAKTKAEKEHMARVAELGCVICDIYLNAPNSPAECHHITTHRGVAQRSKHTEVLPLCPIHHRLGNNGEAIHAGVKTWEAKFDTQENLLNIVNERLKEDYAS